MSDEAILAVLLALIANLTAPLPVADRLTRRAMRLLEPKGDGK